nr:LysR family transcriptional regulator [Lachnospiraceae bacterium]
YFQVAARHGNLSRAAKELYITQPGLSKYLSRLEEEIGVPLFDRRKGKIELNAYGQIFLANVDIAFNQLENGVETIRQLYSQDQNILSVACSIEDFLADQLKDFSPLYPHIRIRQYSYSLSEMEMHLLRQNLDFAICTSPIKNDRIRYDRLSQCPYVLLCHEDNPLGSKESISLFEASECSFLCESSRLSSKQLEQLCKKAGFNPVISHEVVNGYILFNMLESNAGVALVPLAYTLKIPRQFPGNHLRFVKLTGEDIPLAEIGIAYLADRVQTESARCFMQYLREKAEEEMAFLE